MKSIQGRDAAVVERHAAAHREPTAQRRRMPSGTGDGGRRAGVLGGITPTSPRLQSFQTMQAMADARMHAPTMQRVDIDQEEAPLQGRFGSAPKRSATAQRSEAAEPTPHRTGLPDALKQGIEALSGLSMDGVRVHYGSSRPAQLQAHAFAQGRDIHVAPGQERHLPHEAWHVVQQAQGRVRPTMQLQGGIPANDDAALEREADVMGVRAASVQRVSDPRLPHGFGAGAVTPRVALGKVPQGRLASQPQTDFNEGLAARDQGITFEKKGHRVVPYVGNPKLQCDHRADDHRQTQALRLAGRFSGSGLRLHGHLERPIVQGVSRNAIHPGPAPEKAPLKAGIACYRAMKQVKDQISQGFYARGFFAVIFGICRAGLAGGSIALSLPSWAVSPVKMAIDLFDKTQFSLDALGLWTAIIEQQQAGVDRGVGPVAAVQAWGRSFLSELRSLGSWRGWAKLLLNSLGLKALYDAGKALWDAGKILVGLWKLGEMGYKAWAWELYSYASTKCAEVSNTIGNLNSAEDVRVTGSRLRFRTKTRSAADVKQKLSSAKSHLDTAWEEVRRLPPLPPEAADVPSHEHGRSEPPEPGNGEVYPGITEVSLGTALASGSHSSGVAGRSARRAWD